MCTDFDPLHSLFILPLGEDAGKQAEYSSAGVRGGEINLIYLLDLSKEEWNVIPIKRLYKVFPYSLERARKFIQRRCSPRYDRFSK